MNTPPAPFSELSEDTRHALARAADLLRQAQALVICAGAGMGVDSGLPDFRGDEGFWRAYPALGAARLPFTQVAQPATFERDPRLAWGFYGHRLQLYRDTAPHPGFHILRRWAARLPGGAHIFTSNVDGQFQKAGFAPGCVEECHGSIHHLQCLHNCRDDIWPADDLAVQVDAERCLWLGALPRCPHCGGLARPNILMFGDWAWNPERSDRQHTRQQDWLHTLQAGGQRPVIIEIGAGAAVPSVRHFSARTRQAFARNGARLIRINPRQADVSSPQDVALPLGALAALRAIDLWWGESG